MNDRLKMYQSSAVGGNDSRNSMLSLNRIMLLKCAGVIMYN